MPLLLLSKSNPLRWVAIWFRVQTQKSQHLYCFDVPTRCKQHIACDGLFHFIAKAHHTLILLLLPSKPNPLPLGFGLVLGTKLRAGIDPVQCA